MYTTTENKIKEVLEKFWKQYPDMPQNPLHGTADTLWGIVGIGNGTGISIMIMQELYHKGRNYIPQNEEEWEYYRKIYAFLIFEKLKEMELPTDLITEGPPD